MRRIKLIVAYDGTRYCGWQVQPNGRSVQEVLNEALSDLFKTPVTTIGASRTDAGVHALGNVAVFDTEARMPAEKIAFALNTYLPEDIRIQGSEEVPLQFHPRFTETVKTYEYRILKPYLCGSLPSPDFHILVRTSGSGGDAEGGRISGRDARLQKPRDSQSGCDRHGSHDLQNPSLEGGRHDPFPDHRKRLPVQHGPDHCRNSDGDRQRNLASGIYGDSCWKPATAPKPVPTARPEGLTLLQIQYPEWQNLDKKQKKELTLENPYNIINKCDIE